MERATYFKREDYAGPGTRLAILMLDGLVLIGALVSLLIARAVFADLSKANVMVLVSLWPIVCVLYLGPLHASQLGTIGYLLTGYKLVDYRGERPALWRSFVRGCTILVLGFEAITDITCSNCRHTRQIFWDRIAETVVVRKGAQPEGCAELVTYLEFVASLNWEFREPDIMAVYRLRDR
ncbi:MAG: RDD family protein [candidate division Zixibacteria bacterium]|nr:RDD family protein [candidate division Zixibacteria bacterium]